MVLKPSLRQWIPKSPPGGCPFSVLKPTFHFLKGQKVDMVQTNHHFFFLAFLRASCTQPAGDLLNFVFFWRHRV